MTTTGAERRNTLLHPRKDLVTGRNKKTKTILKAQREATLKLHLNMKDKADANAFVVLYIVLVIRYNYTFMNIMDMM